MEAIIPQAASTSLTFVTDLDCYDSFTNLISRAYLWGMILWEVLYVTMDA